MKKEQRNSTTQCFVVLGGLAVLVFAKSLAIAAVINDFDGDTSLVPGVYDESINLPVDHCPEWLQQPEKSSVVQAKYRERTEQLGKCDGRQLLDLGMLEETDTSAKAITAKDSLLLLQPLQTRPLGERPYNFKGVGSRDSLLPKPGSSSDLLLRSSPSYSGKRESVPGPAFAVREVEDLSQPRFVNELADDGLDTTYRQLEQMSLQFDREFSHFDFGGAPSALGRIDVLPDAISIALESKNLDHSVAQGPSMTNLNSGQGIFGATKIESMIVLLGPPLFYLLWTLIRNIRGRHG